MSEVIPEAAVEAAARCFPGYDPDFDGDEIDRAENDAFHARARQILEAAAPHMLADCWDAAYAKGRERGEWEAAPVTKEPVHANPYRTSK